MIYHCKKCGLEQKFEVSPFELKCALNPDLAIKEIWTDDDFERPIGGCKCGGIIESGILPHFISISGEGDYCHISDSLAINPSQAKAHRKLFPGVDVLPDGRLGFSSVKSQSEYCEATGFYKTAQKIKSKGKRIA